MLILAPGPPCSKRSLGGISSSTRVVGEMQGPRCYLLVCPGNNFPLYYVVVCLCSSTICTVEMTVPAAWGPFLLPCSEIRGGGGTLRHIGLVVTLGGGRFQLSPSLSLSPRSSLSCVGAGTQFCVSAGKREEGGCSGSDSAGAKFSQLLALLRLPLMMMTRFEPLPRDYAGTETKGGRGSHSSGGKRHHYFSC